MPPNYADLLTDAADCDLNAVVDLADLLAMLAAFSGIPSWVQPIPVKTVMYVRTATPVWVAAA